MLALLNPLNVALLKVFVFISLLNVGIEVMLQPRTETVSETVFELWKVD